MLSLRPAAETRAGRYVDDRPVFYYGIDIIVLQEKNSPARLGDV
jgi:hypothetical protein